MSNPKIHREQKSTILLELIEVSRIKMLLNYSDVRSVIRWCNENHVFIIKQGNRKFVNKNEFILSFYSPFIQHLKNKHKNWKEVFINFLKGELMELLNRMEDHQIKKERKKYQARTNQEMSFLTLIKKL